MSPNTNVEIYSDTDVESSPATSTAAAAAVQPKPRNFVKTPEYQADWEWMEVAKEHFCARDVRNRTTDTNTDELIAHALLAKPDLHVYLRARAHELLSHIHTHRYTAVDHRDAKYHSLKALEHFQELIDSKEFGSRVSGLYMDGAKKWHYVILRLDNVFPDVDNEVEGGVEGEVKGNGEIEAEGEVGK